MNNQNTPSRSTVYRKLKDRMHGCRPEEATEVLEAAAEDLAVEEPGLSVLGWPATENSGEILVTWPDGLSLLFYTTADSYHGWTLEVKEGAEPKLTGEDLVVLLQMVEAEQRYSGEPLSSEGLLRRLRKLVGPDKVDDHGRRLG